MFHFKNKIKNARKEREKKNYDLTYDNVAIPEVHKAASDATTHNRTPPRTNILPASVLIMSLFRKYISEEKNKLLAKQPALSGTSDNSECPVRQAVFVFLIYRCPSIIHNLIQIYSLQYPLDVFWFCSTNF
mgnify:CR=1 FL=1